MPPTAGDLFRFRPYHEPTMQIVDAHHHLWDLGKLHYPWLAEPIDHPMGDYAAIRRNYLIGDFRADAAGQGLVKSVHVQAEVDHADPVAETAWLQAVADDPASGGLPSGIVAYADLASPEVDGVLERHCSHANMRGIRDMLNFEPDTPRFCFAARGDLMQDPGWRAGYARLRAHGLSFDLQLWWQQMADAARLAADFDDIQMILNHTGMPRLFDPDYLAGWRRGMRELAAAPNVAVKISGLCMFDRGWSTDSIRPFVEHTIECFGVDRCMFASNFPVESLMSSYDSLWDAFSEITRDYSETERAKLFHDNAVRIDRLD